MTVARATSRGVINWLLKSLFGFDFIGVPIVVKNSNDSGTAGIISRNHSD
jgi:hypothetical protein